MVTQTISARFPEEVYDQARHAADMAGISFNTYVVQAVQAYNAATTVSGGVSPTLATSALRVSYANRLLSETPPATDELDRVMRELAGDGE